MSRFMTPDDITLKSIAPDHFALKNIALGHAAPSLIAPNQTVQHSYAPDEIAAGSATKQEVAAAGPSTKQEDPSVPCGFACRIKPLLLDWFPAWVTSATSFEAHIRSEHFYGLDQGDALYLSLDGAPFDLVAEVEAVVGDEARLSLLTPIPEGVVAFPFPQAA